MTRGAAFECGAAGATLIAGDVRSDLERAARCDELGRVLALSAHSVIRRLPGNAVSSNRARLRERVEWLKLGSAISMSRNRRNSSW